MLSFAGQHQRPGGEVDLVEQFMQLGDVLGVQGVPHLRPVEPQMG